jgi:hypothetical protein
LGPSQATCQQSIDLSGLLNGAVTYFPCRFQRMRSTAN